MEKTAEFRLIPGSHYHMVGIGGIGMSGLAQMLAASGCRVSGSDRGLNQPENQRIFSSLKAQGIRLYEQDGSYIKDSTPDAIIYSSAIENDNPDFVKAGDAVPHVHRSAALSAAMLESGTRMIAVSGSCGKTTVTSWLAEMLGNLGKDPSFLTGGLVKKYANGKYAGNYYKGAGEYFVFEADESDRSLVAYHPDYALLLNIGTDHYSKEELAEVFKKFLNNVKIGAVIEESVYKTIKDGLPARLKVKTFSADMSADSDADWKLSSYCATAESVKAVFNSEYEVTLPAPGVHTAANALAIIAMTEMMGLDVKKALAETGNFGGVWRRFDFAGKNSAGASVYDDYAHNVEKIMSCIKAAREITAGQIYAVFQPHGFGPLGFMKEELGRVLKAQLKENETFALLPVFYAGGTTSFKPSSQEVVNEFHRAGLENCMDFGSRGAAEDFLERRLAEGDTVLVMGARDNSLSDWAEKLAAK